MVKELKNLVDFADAVGNEKTGLVVVDFFADWCGPCKMIAPKFAKLSEKYPTVGFYKINSDNKDMIEVTKACQITSLPTFCFFNGGKYTTNMTGANDKELEKLIVQYIPEPSNKQE